MNADGRNRVKQNVQEKAARVLEMLAEGTQPKAISIELGVSASFVSDIGRQHGYRFRERAKGCHA